MKSINIKSVHVHFIAAECRDIFHEWGWPSIAARRCRLLRW